MATLQQIYVTLITGSVVGVVSLCLFGGALRCGYNRQLAPRSWSRPQAILKNVLKQPYSFSWIAWSLSQTYPDLMAGIPGTGTRQDGWSGTNLKVNLDGIIMLKYHVMLLKLSLLATVLCTCIILPMNVTADCDEKTFGAGTCDPIANLTDFEITTIAHIPPLQYNETNADGSQKTVTSSFFWELSVSGRYLGIVLVSWVIYRYTCHLIWNEWIENLALRRTFFLEHDHYEERLDELNTVLKYTTPEDPKQQSRPPWLPHPELRETIPNVSMYSCLYQLPNQITTVDLPDTATDLDRQLAATVDFFDRCVPNQPGFTSSVAAVTILPEPAHVANAWKKWYYSGKKLRQLRYIRSHIKQRLKQKETEEEDWVEDDKAEDEGKHIFFTTKSLLGNTEARLDLTAPGDIEEGKTTVTEAEAKHSAISSIYEKTQISLKCDTKETDETRPENEILNQPFNKEEDSLLELAMVSEMNVQRHEGAAETLPEDSIGNSEPDSTFSIPAASIDVEKRAHEEEASFGAFGASTFDSMESPGSSLNQFNYRHFDADELADNIGFAEEAELENLVSDVGIEQLSVYAREYAQSSSSCCPYGFGAELIHFSSLEKLRELEERAIEKVRNANEELVAARETVNDLTSGIVVVTQPDAHKYDPGTSKKDDGQNVVAHEDGYKSGNSALSVGRLRQRSWSTSSKKWQQAQKIASSIQSLHRESVNKTNCCLGWGRRWSKSTQAMVATFIPGITADEMRPLKTVVNILEHPTYAVVTFTSRQAAVAARQCLADGGGLDRWIEIEELPVAPLADAPPWDIMFCRGCCRPVTLTISEKEKKCRRIAGITIFLLFCFFYTVPLSLTSQLLNPEKLATVFPEWEALHNPDSFFFQVLSGISSGLLYTIFFSFCPQLFKAIANFEGNVSSKRTAEDKALAYYWYFMMLTAFTGTTLLTMLSEGFVSGFSLGQDLKEALVSVADSIPTQQAPVWMNWLIVRFTYTLPFMYLFQANTFGFSIINWQCCSRLMQGGGPGGPPPFRIFVDSGTAFMCVVAMAPVCPLIAPVALAYFVVMLLMLRWLLVFVYRPWYDAGGNKWPALHDILISATIFGQVLLTAIIALRNSYIASAMCGLPILPTFFFSQTCKDKFLRAYNDTGLLQSSGLDGWDNKGSTSKGRREEYRKWLADCHKASYVPICLAGSESLLTVEPAVVVPTRRDKDSGSHRGLLKRSQRGARFFRTNEEGHPSMRATSGTPASLEEEGGSPSSLLVSC